MPPRTPNPQNQNQVAGTRNRSSSTAKLATPKLLPGTGQPSSYEVDEFLFMAPRKKLQIRRRNDIKVKTKNSHNLFQFIEAKNQTHLITTGGKLPM